jgi:hypothetical protein
MIKQKSSLSGFEKILKAVLPIIKKINKTLSTTSHKIYAQIGFSNNRQTFNKNIAAT